ncbi:MAG: hypothetical protein AAGL24_08310 [Pseudomonadota bacterium]
MKRQTSVGALAVAILLAAWATPGIAQTADAVADAFLAEMHAFADAVESVTDQASAANAVKAMRVATDRMQALSEQHEALISSPSMTAAMMQRQNALMSVQLRIGTAMSALVAGDPALLQILSDEMDRMPDFGGE